MTRYLVAHATAGNIFVTDGTEYSEDLYYLDWRQEDTYELRHDLDLFDFDLSLDNGWDTEPELRYIAEQETGKPVRRIDR